MYRVRWTVALAVCAAVATLSAAEDPFSGTWRLNTAKSKYTPGPAPEKAEVTIQSDGMTQEVKTEVTFEGKVINTSSKAKLDGTPAKLEGSPVADMTSVKKVDERTRELTSMKNGKTVGKSKAVISADGKTITVTGTGLNPKGEKVQFTAVYEKQ
jgi:hypothetical protein